MKESFISNPGLSKQSLKMLQTINGILDEYISGGYILTLRQLYYQLVSRGIIPNKQAEYAKISSILVKGRMAGLVDRGVIEDRLRSPYLPYRCHSVADAIDDTIKQYRLDRMRNQDNYVEVWVEKDALSGVLRRITSKYGIRLMVNRGYSSCSAMYDASKRFINAGAENNYIIYLGDHDPSGLDMIRDVNERLAEFGVNVEIMHLGITMEQIDKYSPPPNPAKITDPRAEWYIKNYGNISWEVDALPPELLTSLLENQIKEYIDMQRYLDILEMEKSGKQKLEDFKIISEQQYDD